MSEIRDRIIASQDRPDRQPKRVSVPEWGTDVWLRVLTVGDQMALGEATDPKQMPVAVLLACVVDESGERVFTEEDREMLEGEDFPLILRLFSEAARLNGLTNAELEEAMAAFGIARGESPSTGSHSLSGDPSENSQISSPAPS